MYEKTALVAFGQRLRLLRKTAPLSQCKLAERSHVSQSTISRVENGEYPTVTSLVVRLLAQALSCTPEHLLEGTGFAPADRVPYEWRTRPVWKG